MERDAEVSTVLSTFEDGLVKAIVVVDNGEYEGVLTRRDLISSHNPPGRKVGTAAVSAPMLSSDTGLRETARLMVESGIHTLPVVADGTVTGVVTARDVLAGVREGFGVFDVEEVYTPDLVTIRPETTFGQALARFRNHGITHLPVVDGDNVVGMVSLTDVLQLAVREMHRVGGGSSTGAAGSAQGLFRTQSGQRTVERDSVLQTPIRDLMSEHVATASPSEGLDAAIDRMNDRGVSSLVVVDDGPIGILTTTDALEALAREPEESLHVQLFNANLLENVSENEVSALIERTTRKYAALDVLEAKVHLHEHKERRHGVSLLLARIRLYTSEGTFVVSAEGFGARVALGEAVAKLERKLMDAKGTRQAERRAGVTAWLDEVAPLE